MKIATLLFTYNRSYHTKLVINALKKNKMPPQKLLVFQDGLKKETDEIEWSKVNSIINEIDWCDAEINVAERNRGLAESIISGINYAFKKYEAVIVLEDDCVPSENFICFMNQCFDKYDNDKRIYSVSGYSWPIQLAKQQYDVYGCGRISSWGWGTWKDRWKIYEKDYEIIKKIKLQEISSKNLAVWGQDLEDILIGNIKGDCDSWAVFWALNVIVREGISITPYRSFIKNIGMDGSGVHCAITDKFEVECIDKNQNSFLLPDKIELLDETKKAFASLYGNYTAISECDGGKKKVLVYGVGNFFKRNERRINEDYYIEKFIDVNKKGYYAGKQIVKPDHINGCDFEKIIIMIQDETESLKIIHNMVTKYGVSEKDIELGYLKYSI